MPQKIPCSGKKEVKITNVEIRNTLLSTTAIGNLLKTIAGFAAAIGIQ